MKKIIPKFNYQMSGSYFRDLRYSLHFRTITVSFALGLVLLNSSCKKSQPSENDLKPQTISQTPVNNDLVKISNEEFRLIDKYANNIPKRDSLYKVILSRIDFNKLNKTKSSDTRTNDIGDDINEETAEFQTDNLGEYLGTDMSGNTSYNVRRVFSLQKINKSLIITVPIVYGPTALTHSTVTATVIGNNLGEFSTPSTPFVNLSYNSDGVSGDCGGDLIEKKTLIYTTNGQIVVKGGLNAGIYTAGAQITGGLTISSSKNSTADYNYALGFTASNPTFANSPPEIKNTGGYAKYLAFN